MTELREKRSEIIELARARGASHVRVFGSVARGEAGEGSDVDFIVDLEPGQICATGPDGHDSCQGDSGGERS